MEQNRIQNQILFKHLQFPKTKTHTQVQLKLNLFYKRNKLESLQTYMIK